MENLFGARKLVFIFLIIVYVFIILVSYVALLSLRGDHFLSVFSVAMVFNLVAFIGLYLKIKLSIVNSIIFGLMLPVLTYGAVLLFFSWDSVLKGIDRYVMGGVTFRGVAVEIVYDELGGVDGMVFNYFITIPSRDAKVYFVFDSNVFSGCDGGSEFYLVRTQGSRGSYFMPDVKNNFIINESVRSDDNFYRSEFSLSSCAMAENKILNGGKKLIDFRVKVYLKDDNYFKFHSYFKGMFVENNSGGFYVEKIAESE